MPKPANNFKRILYLLWKTCEHRCIISWATEIFVLFLAFFWSKKTSWKMFFDIQDFPHPMSFSHIYWLYLNGVPYSPDNWMELINEVFALSYVFKAFDWSENAFTWAFRFILFPFHFLRISCTWRKFFI